MRTCLEVFFLRREVNHFTILQHLSALIHFILQRLESEHKARTEEARAAAAAAANLQAHAEQQLEAGKATIAQVRE